MDKNEDRKVHQISSSTRFDHHQPITTTNNPITSTTSALIANHDIHRYPNTSEKPQKAILVPAGNIDTPLFPRKDNLKPEEKNEEKISPNENIKLEIPSEYYEIKASEIQYGQQLGEGGFGTVYEGYVAGQCVAIKKLKIQDLNENELGKFKKEVALMCKLRHPNIVLLLGACMKPGELAIITEILKCSMKEIIHSKREVTLAQKLSMARDTALAMNWLHKRDPPILHLDLKPDNLLIDDIEHLRVKVTDFGLSVIKSPGKSIRRVGGTRRYMSPEAMQKQRVDEKADVYSYGIVLWELYTRTLPYKEFNKLKDEDQKQAHSRIVVEGRRPEIPADMPTGLAQLITACWHKNPNERPNFDHVIHWLDDIILETTISDPAAVAFWKGLCSSEINVVSLLLPLFFFFWTTYSAVLADETEH
eukprot:TRINITY_DN2839_c0_g3_i2.p1 TRINITY_DN2839_c0_g3~~TRINITY_DN2839_c0_g3_i2.p1  ORF type:complete len:477 (-),score=74.58 TRINITY_DN2839_c0_g3_i2:953-2209(-)